MTQSILTSCIDIVKSLVGHEYLYFDHAIEIRSSPHSFPFKAWAASVSPKDILYVMDSNEQWHEVSIADEKAAMVVGSLYQRLKLMRIDYAKAS
jgi:hypothetical protein